MKNYDLFAESVLKALHYYYLSVLVVYLADPSGRAV
jgi:hypothetical protein